MNRDAIEDLFDYTGFAWAMIGQTVRGMPPESLTKSVPGSGWPSLREALRHTVGAYDYWLHATLGYGTLIDPAAGTMTLWDAFDAYHAQMRSTFQRVLSDTPDDKLHEPFSRVYDEGDGAETLSLSDILTNLLLHERGHHGDISTLFYQLGAKPPFLDYRMYAYLKRTPESPLRPPGW